MKIYIAGPLCLKQEREFLEEIDKLCKNLGFQTFLPHRDCGLWNNKKKFKEIADCDLNGFKECDIVIANLNGFNVGAGTAWEMGYAYAKQIPIIAIKTDKKIKQSIEEISAIILGLTKIVTSIKDLKKELLNFSK